MRDSVIQSTDLKGGFDLFHLLNLCIFRITSIWMNDLMLIILLKLPDTLLETIEVVEEREHRPKVITI